MEQRVSVVTLGVSDLERSRGFYERLGWKSSAGSGAEIVFFQIGAMALALYPRDALAAEAGLSPKGEGFAGVTLAYNTRERADVDAVLAQAQAAGATILVPARVASWGGYSCYFADPDGFAWEVAWNPGFAISPDGGIVLPE